MPTKEGLSKVLDNIDNIKCGTEKAIFLMCKLMKMQLFNDGNKRLAMLIANHELIRLGKGIISVSEENKVEFGTKLIAYYENDEKLGELMDFVYDKCLDGMTRM